MPSADDAEQLWKRLHAARLSWQQRREDRFFVAVALRAEAGDLALLLRDVEAWIGGCGVAQVRFELDGRRYALQAGPAAVSGPAD
jgi:hypothetical protein